MFFECNFAQMKYHLTLLSIIHACPPHNSPSFVVVLWDKALANEPDVCSLMLEVESVLDLHVLDVVPWCSCHTIISALPEYYKLSRASSDIFEIYSSMGKI